MEEIQERKEAYMGATGRIARWRDGKLEMACYAHGKPEWGTWEDAAFKRGEMVIIDPLTSEFVCPPKPERPYDHTTGQMIDTIKGGEKWECNKNASFSYAVQLHANGGIVWVGAGNRFVFTSEAMAWMWRKVEE